jgi:hypothetical protein
MGVTEQRVIGSCLIAAGILLFTFPMVTAAILFLLGAFMLTTASSSESSSGSSSPSPDGNTKSQDSKEFFQDILGGILDVFKETRNVVNDMGT